MADAVSHGAGRALRRADFPRLLCDVRRGGAVADLRTGLIEALVVYPGSSAADLQRLTGVSKRVINSQLYRDPVFVRDDGDPPVWWVDAPAPERGDHEEFVLDGTLPLRPWQSDAVERWHAAGRLGIVEAVTGAGKTIVGVAAVADALARGRRVEVLVPTKELQSQWVSSIGHWLPRARVGRRGDGHRDDFDSADVVVSIVNTAARHPLRGVTGALLVADECHRYGSETLFRRALLPGYRTRLGLTATLERSDEGVARVLRPYFGATCLRVGYGRALEEGAIARFRVGLLGVDFTERERAAYDRLADERTELNATLSTWISSAAGFHAFLAAVQDLADDDDHEGYRVARRWLWVWNAQRELLAMAEGKVGALRRLALPIAEADRTLVFVFTIDQARRAVRLLASRGLPAEAVHSDLDADERAALMDRFRTGRTSVVVAPRLLDEGVDVPDADFAVVLAAFQSRRQMIQRMGRVLRLKQDGRAARFVICYVRGTTEDPVRGAHEDFLGEVTKFADEVHVLDPTNARDFDGFLKP
jgi:superfamily II DNA or RNA helicase